MDSILGILVDGTIPWWIAERGRARASDDPVPQLTTPMQRKR